MLMKDRYYKFKRADFTLSSVGVLILSLILMIWCFHITTVFLSFNESRLGYHMFDPILSIVPAIDLSVPLFYITYLSIFFGLILCFTSVRDIIIAVQAMTVLLILRMICMSMVPLEPPIGILPLHDDFLSRTFYDNKILLKDLFFSGHTASIAILAYLIQHKLWSRTFFIISFIVGTMLIVQHVHYTLDVVCAYMFSFIAYRLGIYLSDQSLLVSRFAVLRLVRNGIIRL